MFKNLWYLVYIEYISIKFIWMKTDKNTWTQLIKSMEDNTALTSVIRSLEIERQVKLEKMDGFQFEDLVHFIDDLIQNDFNRLLRILYRVDISEQKLKLQLAQNKEKGIPSAEIIAKLLIEREEQKILSRAKYKDM